MPSQRHEALLELFRNRPALAAELLRDALGVELPEYTEVRLDSADLTEVQPAAYRADLVVLLYDGRPVLGIIVEVQLRRDRDKPLVWPVYATGLRARIRCPVELLVVCTDDSVARWAAQPIHTGRRSVFEPIVLSPSGVPVVSEPTKAANDPELAVLSAMSHGPQGDIETAVAVAIAAIDACAPLDAQRSMLYVDLVLSSLSEAAKKALESMDPAKYQYQSEFAKRYVSEGRQEGRQEGEAQIVLKLLRLRFGKLSAETVERVNKASESELERYAEHILDAQRLDDVFGD